jgi:hypothetical protein
MAQDDERNPFEAELGALDAHTRLPPFFKPNPELWFLQLESIFRSHRITSSASKFHAVVGALDTQILTLLQDLLRDPGPTPYETLRARIMQEFGDTERQRIQHLLENEQLGDRRPTHFLHHLRSLAGGLAADGLLKSLWLRGLPQRVQELLTVVNYDHIDDLARVADKAMEITPAATISAMQPSRETTYQDSFLYREIKSLQTQLAALSTKVDSLAKKVSRSKSRGRSATPRQKASDFCYYHERFGDAAKSCRAPCSHPKAQEKNGNV